MSRVAPKFKVKKKKLGQYPYLSVTVSIAMALFVVGVFSSLIIYSKELEKAVREGITVQVFLQNNTTEASRKKIQNALAARYFVAQRPPAKKAVRFVSKQAAAAQFIRETGEDFQQFLGENPLRDAFLVHIDPDYQDTQSMVGVKKDIQKIRGVFQVYYVENVIDSINRNIMRISLVLFGVGALLFLVVILLINNSVRLAMFSQRFLIRSMQLVGATSWFIQRSFLYRGMLNGLLGGVCASALLYWLIYEANLRIDGLGLIYNSQKTIFLLFTLILVGVGVSSLSTYQAVNRFLKLSLDELY